MIELTEPCYNSPLMNGCQFCLENNLLRVDIVYEDDLWYFTGIDSDEGSNAGMAITKRHVSTPFEINGQEWLALHKLMPTLKDIIDNREEPQGYNLGWNVGLAGGQTVPHAHLHIAARYDDEELANKGIRYHFKAFRNKRKSARD